MARIVFHYLRIKDVFQYFTRDACERDRSIVTCILLVAFFEDSYDICTEPVSRKMSVF